MLTTSLFIATLCFAPPETPASAPEPNAETYQMLLGEIARLNTLINEGEEVGDELEDTIKQLYAQAPLLAADDISQQLRTTALLNLARARLLADLPTEAATAMDEAIRLAHGQAVEVADYGPALVALYEERLASIGELGTASLQVVCTTPCSVYVDEQPAAVGVSELALGIHRVWIQPSAPESSAAAEIHHIEMASPGEVIRLNYSAERPPVPKPRKTPKSAPKRLAPAPAEIVMIVVGAGLVIAGAVTMTSEADSALAVGGTVAGLGGATLLTGSVLLGIDQAAQSKAKTARVMVGWTFRF